MKKNIAFGSAFAVALGLAACTQPATEEDEAPAEETAEAVEEETATDGTMTGEASAEEGEGEGGDAAGPDEDGNPVGN